MRIAKQAIPRLKELGYSHVHVSPPQKSNERVWLWWGRYQPVDFGPIAGPLGSEAEFKAMNDAVSANGIEIVIDDRFDDPFIVAGIRFHDLSLVDTGGVSRRPDAYGRSRHQTRSAGSEVSTASS